MFSRIIEHNTFVFLADHGAEIDYIIGTLYTALVSSRTGQTPLLLLPTSLSTAVNLSWNYLDAVFDLMLAAKEFTNTKDYKQVQCKIQAVMSVFSGTQLFVFSYNPPLTQSLGFDDPTAFAASSFALAAWYDLGVAALELYNQSQELKFEGWLKERIKQLKHAQTNGHETDHLIDAMKSRSRVYVNTDPNTAKKVLKLFLEHFPIDRPELKKLILDLEKKEAEHIHHNQLLEYKLQQSYKQCRTNLVLKIISSVGMTLMAIVGFLGRADDSYSSVLVWGLALTTFVAASYLILNGERLSDKISSISPQYFFKECKSSEPPEPVPKVIASSEKVGNWGKITRQQ